VEACEGSMRGSKPFGISVCQPDRAQLKPYAIVNCDAVTNTVSNCRSCDFITYSIAITEFIDYAY
jgi:hypothetical protein